jgi:MFS family permease
VTTPLLVLDSPVAVTDESTFSRSNLLRLAALTPAVLLIHGYHPFADDAGIYVAGIRKLAHPALYQPDAPFVLANTHLSVFAHLLAAVIQVTHLPLTFVLLVTHLVSIYVFLLAGWSVASRVFTRLPERWFAVAFAAACFTLPAAGTALVLMDPYVTSRSFSTPLGLFAVAAVLDRRWRLAAFLIVLTGLMHPQMVLYAAALALLYAVLDTAGLRAAVLTGAAGIVAAGLIALVTRHEPVSAAYFEAMHSSGRTYYFLAQWRWYEDFGLAAPLALYALTVYRSEAGSRMRKLCLACIVLGVSSIMVSFLFVHPSGPYLLVRVEILRSFHTLYLVGVLLLGGWLGSVFWYRQSTRWVVFVLLAIAAGGLFAAQRASYPDSAHIEWPWMHPRNQWVQAYWWIRANTPANAVFAADPGLNFLDGVDMQSFRVTTERSILADNKDQGVAAGVNPSIAGLWAAQHDAQVGINQMSDRERIARLKPFGVTWLLLPSSAGTNFSCPYQNAVAKVCRMQE